MLGDTYQQMVDDGLSWPKIAVAGRTALFWFGISPEAGRRYWESVGGVAPGNPIPRRRARRRRGRAEVDLSAPGTYGPMILAAARTTQRPA
ncbi:hypothetical protein GS886_26310 [Rhodococcus hoagii]|nr:hypothetical protein [Prescottella equi]